MKIDFIKALAFAAMLTPAAAHAQTYPSRPVTMVVPYAAGGTFDVLGRIMAVRMGELLGQTVIVENTTGAGGIVGVNRVIIGQTRRLHDPARHGRHPRLQPDDLQEAALRRDQRFHPGDAVLRAADGARGAQGSACQYVRGVRRALKAERREDAVRLGRRRFHHASGLLAAQRQGRRQRHARALSRLGAGDERPDRRADRLCLRQSRRRDAADHRQAGEGAGAALERALAADAGACDRA